MSLAETEEIAHAFPALGLVVMRRCNVNGAWYTIDSLARGNFPAKRGSMIFGLDDLAREFKRVTGKGYWASVTKLEKNKGKVQP